MGIGIEKSLKRYLKRKVKITLGFIVAFLLGSSFIFADNIYIKEGQNGIEFSTDNINWGENPCAENTFENNLYTNNKELEEVRFSSIPNAQGIEISFINNFKIEGEGTSPFNSLAFLSGIKFKNFENFGQIKGTTDKKIIGIYKGTEVEKLSNNGLIEITSTKTDFKPTNSGAIGIENNSGKISTLLNDGIIKVTAFSGRAYGINYSSGTIENLYNNGTMKVIRDKSGENGISYGIHINGSMTNLINQGRIDVIGEASTAYGINITSGEEITKLENTGIINTEAEDKYISNGIVNRGKITEILNIGVMTNSGADGNGATMGIDNNGADAEIKNITNKGKIKVENNVKNKMVDGISNGGTIQTLLNEGIIKAKGSEETVGYNIYGISNNGTIEALMNTGIIIAEGKNASIIKGTITNPVNKGLFIGSSFGFKGTNNGIMFKWDNKKSNYKIYGREESKDNIMNAALTGEQGNGTANWTATGSESFKFEGTADTGKIYNGITNTIEVNGIGNSLTDSTINGYTSAIVFGKDGGELKLNNTLINGGLADGTAAVLGSEKADTLTLENAAIINGEISLGNDNDTLSLDDTVQINDNLFGGGGTDELTFISSSEQNKNINVFNKVDGFENITVETDVTLFENAEVTGAENINLAKDGNLVLRIDGTDNNKHALSGNIGTIHSDGGKLLLALNGVGEGTVIEFGNTTLDDTMKGNEIGYSKDITIDTTSLLHNISKNDNNSVTVNTVADLPVNDTPENIDYKKLNEIYQSIRSTDQVKEFKVSEKDQLTAFTKYLHDIYAGNPYAFSSELSRKSMGMFKDSALSKDLMPRVNKWAVYGGLTHVDGGTKDSFYGKGYYTYDIGSRDIEADTKITGAFAQFEYGKSETLKTGFIFGGNSSQTEIGASKVEGDSLYFGAFTKKYINDFRFTLGAGFQHGDYKADRTALGYGVTDTRSYSENYHDRGFNIYGDVKYSKELGNNFYFEPGLNIEYSYVDQDGADEGSEVLAIETDSRYFDYTTAEVNLDIKKVIPAENVNHVFTAGISYERFLSGYDEEYITGRMKDNGTDFDILVSEKEKDNFALNLKYEFEKENGFIFDIKGQYRFEHGNNEDEWIAGIGTGYKF